MNTLRRFLSKPLAVSALAFFMIVVVGCFLASFVAPYSPLAQDLSAAHQLPSAAHLLGTDTLGRDILSRLLYGGQVTLLGSLIAVTVFILLGVPLGLMAGYRRGWLDTLLTRIVELLFAVPVIVILLVVLSVFSTNIVAAMVTLGILGFGSIFRVVRATTMSAANELYVKAARASGLRPTQVVVKHILPNLLGPVIVQVTLFAASAVLTESGLAFLGFSVAPPDPSWGSMIREASQSLSSFPWEVVPSGLIITLVVLALGLIGDGVRDAVAREGQATAQARAAVRIPQRQVTPPDDKALLSVRDLAVAFGPAQAPTVVIRNVSFDVAPGEAVGIVGESGSGKTVTARAILGILANGGRIVQGTVHYHGQLIGGPNGASAQKVRGSEIGLIPQEPMNTLDPVFTIGSQLREVIRRHDGGTRRRADERAIELLEVVGLHDPEAVAKRYPHELSGGMAQRVGIALALAGRPKLLIADEATTALDVTVQRQILDLLTELRARFNTAIIVVTHDWGVLADLCDRAVVMYAGEVVEQASTVELFDSPLHPYTRALIAANPHLAEAGKPLPSIPGQVPEPARWPAGCHFADRCPLVTQECREHPIELEYPGQSRESRCIHVDEMKRVAA